MKRLSLTISVFCALFSLVGYSNAQCVQCLPSQQNPNNLSCQSASAGGKECAGGGATCSVAGACGGRGSEEEIYRAEGGNSLTQPSGNCFKEKIGKVEFDKNIIREVGQRHARLAIALAWLNQSGFLGMKDVKISLLPLEMNNDVYNKWLNNISAESQQTALSAADKSASKRERLPSPPKGAEPIVYAVDIITSENSTNKIIRFSPIKSSPLDATFTSLDLILEEVAFIDSVANSEKRWRVINWEIK